MDEPRFYEQAELDRIHKMELEILVDFMTICEITLRWPGPASARSATAASSRGMTTSTSACRVRTSRNSSASSRRRWAINTMCSISSMTRGSR